MEIGQQGHEAQILHLGDGLGHGGINQHRARGRGRGVARPLGVGPEMIDQGGQDAAAQHEGRHARPEQEERQRAGEPGAQGAGAFAAGHACGQHHKAARQPGQSGQRGQGIGQRTEQEQAAPSLRGHDQTHGRQQAHIVADEIGKDGMPFL